MTKEKKYKDTKIVLLGAGLPFKGQDHSGLKYSGSNSNLVILDWIISSVINISPDISFVGGYQLEKIKEKYPELKFIKNNKWKDTKSSFSFLKTDLDVSNDYLVSYVDIVYRNSLPINLMNSNSDITIAVDSKWLQRYTDRDAQDILATEKVCIAQDIVTRLGKDINLSDVSAEFVGVVKFSKDVIKYIKEQSKSFQDLFRLSNLSELVEHLRTKGFSISAVDTYGDWAELNNPRDISQFVLGTKAETLYRLKDLVKKSKILDQYTFTVSQWKSNPEMTLAEIAKSMKKKKIIIRSSALSEDTFDTANAGAFESILDVDSTKASEMITSINEVIESYPDDNDLNQILVQPMIKNVEGSGVIFTRTLERGSPYYVINYDDVSKSTESVTSGSTVNFKTFKIRRNESFSKGLPIAIINLLSSVKEIENLFSHDRLDIEFAINNKNQVNILQVRPIAVSHDFNNVQDETVDKAIKSAKKYFVDLQINSHSTVGDKAFFGSMPDWNPAEIIGTRPNRLASDLYNHQIMSNSWAIQRHEYGYRDVRLHGLMKFFCGQPYVDIRASFNSFIPKNLDAKISKKFVNFYMEYLRKHPEFHDKVEFEVVPTCFSFSFHESKEKFLTEGNFSSNEISALEEELKQITKNAINGNIHNAGSDISFLKDRCKLINKSNINNLTKAIYLIEDSRSYGTVAFSHYARDGFVAATILKSAVKTGIISQIAMDEFMNSIRSVTHDLTEDAGKVKSGKLEWKKFVEKYGHLRPDTYNITSDCYSSDPKFFLEPIVKKYVKVDHNKAFENWEKEKHNLFNSLKSEDICDNSEIIENFLIESIEGREYAKFIFTRNLSNAIELLASFGQEMGLSRQELSKLPLDIFFEFNKCRDVTKFKNITNYLLEEESLQSQITASIELPPLIFSTSDFDHFILPKTLGNFIGEKKLISEIVCIDSSDKKVNLNGKIVMIEKADPGYDWIFGRNISGLITKYGGANSHMAIRSAEFGLPAVIGIGEQLYNDLKNSQILEIDCSNNTLRKVR
jgi:choline kinase/phosphohistidine swiveling domain-containing protein